MKKISKADQRKGGKLNNKWLGKYEIINIHNNCVSLKNLESNIILKRKINISNIKPLLEFTGELKLKKK